MIVIDGLATDPNDLTILIRYGLFFFLLFAYCCNDLITQFLIKATFTASIRPIKEDNCPYQIWPSIATIHWFTLGIVITECGAYGLPDRDIESS